MTEQARPPSRLNRNYSNTATQTTQLYKTCVTLVAGQLDHLTFSCCGDIYWCRPTRVAGLATKVVINQFAKIYCPPPPHSTPVDGTHNIYSTQYDLVNVKALAEYHFCTTYYFWLKIQ